MGRQMHVEEVQTGVINVKSSYFKDIKSTGNDRNHQEEQKRIYSLRFRRWWESHQGAWERRPVMWKENQRVWSPRNQAAVSLPRRTGCVRCHCWVTIVKLGSEYGFSTGWMVNGVPGIFLPKACVRCAETQERMKELQESEAVFWSQSGWFGILLGPPRWMGTAPINPPLSTVSPATAHHTERAALSGLCGNTIPLTSFLSCQCHIGFQDPSASKAEASCIKN